MPHHQPLRVTVALLLVLALAPAVAGAAGIADWNGHLGFGYSKLFRTDSLAPGVRTKAPSGSLSLGVGVDHAVGRGWRAGVAMGYHMLGSTTVPRGSLTAGIDFTVLDFALLVSRDFPGRRALLRVAAGPGLMNARAELSAAGGGALFSDLAVSRTAPAAALEFTVLTSAARPVRLGLETGLRVGFIPDDIWTVWDTRVAIHY